MNQAKFKAGHTGSQTHDWLSQTHVWEVRDELPSALSLAKSPHPLLCFLCRVSLGLCSRSSEIASVLLTFNLPDSPGHLALRVTRCSFHVPKRFTLKAIHMGASARGSLQDWTSKMGSAFVFKLSRLKRRQVGRSWGHFQTLRVSSQRLKREEPQGTVLNSPPCSCYQGRGGCVFQGWPLTWLPECLKIWPGGHFLAACSAN